MFDTIATEAQRQLYENFSLFIRSFLPRYPQPEADAIENLSMAVIVDQKRLGGGSTLDGRHDHRHLHRAAAALLARSASRTSATRTRSRSTTRRACAPSATAWARRSASSSDDFLDLSKSLNEGAIQVPFWGSWEIDAYAASGFFDNDKKLADYTPEEMDLLLYGKDRKYKLRDRRQVDERHVPRRHREVRAGVRPARHQDAAPSGRRRRSSRTCACGRARCARAPA